MPAATAPTKEEFRTRYPEFPVGAVSDPTLDAVLTDTTLFVDTRWTESDRKPAMLALAAHFLRLAQAVGGSSSSTDDGTGGTVETPFETYVKTIKFKDRELIFDKKGGSSSTSSSSSTNAAIVALADAFASREAYSKNGPLALTPYGQFFLSLRRRNIIPIVVLN